MKKENMKRILSSCIVLSMILTGFAVIAPTGPISTIVTADNPQDPETHPSIRMYGEEYAVYPTHSYWGYDFIYPDELGVFEPGIISKDSITFNPAFMDMEYPIDGDEITISGSDASEKVFLRMFYEPGYTHDIDQKMLGCSNALLEPVETFDSIVTETTYFLVSHNRNPMIGTAGNTHFMLPYKSLNPDKPGMDTAEVIDLANVEDGRIWVETQYSDLGTGAKVSFMDHTLEYCNYQTDLNQVKVKLTYDGNMYGAHDKEKTQYVDLEQSYYVNRNNNIQEDTDPCHRWYFNVHYWHDGTVDLTVGRVLDAGETFYVNGVRYDMPYIYTLNDPGSDELGLEYITFQTPIPKCPEDAQIWYTEDLDDNYNDWSHVTSQWLANLRPNDIAWVLPPFNEDHVMIDDIGIEKIDNGDQGCEEYEVDWEIPRDGIIYDEMVGPLDFYYIIEYMEPRFDTSLTERFYAYPDCEYKDGDKIEDDGECNGWNETWMWLNGYTKPIRFTEFVLPDQEETGGDYDIEDIPNFYLMKGGKTTADGFEYILTSSFLSPNSDTYEDLIEADRWDFSKKYYWQHDILDVSYQIENDEEQSRMCYEFWPRMTFEYDAVDGTDIYINDIEDQSLCLDNDVSVRIYGEEDFIYPTHSWSHECPMWYDDFIEYEMNWDHIMGDFIYPHNALPFYPGSIPKDSITFNPAFLYMDYHGEEINVNGGDSSEKVFYRTFYEPEFYHDIDRKMHYWSDSALEELEIFDAIVTETTYMMVDHDRLPVAGKSVETDIMLPYKSSNPDKPGMDTAMVVELADVGDGGTDYVLTDGNISVEDTWIDVGSQESVTFMDHTITFHNYNTDRGQVRFEVKYEGNMYGAHAKPEIVYMDIGETYYFNRNNNNQTWTDPAYRWYASCDYYHDGKVDLTIGRVLEAGETFYVNGVRYDMPAIYVEEIWNNGEPDYLGFKYITFQTPIPKCPPGSLTWYTDDLNDNYNDWTHVTSQWLANLMPGEEIWVLPPFNEQHLMIDDIGLEEFDNGKYNNDIWVSDWEVPIGGILLEEMKNPLVYCYASEYYEPRFDSSLAERLFTQNEPVNNWRWFNVGTYPMRYTEFVLPDQEVEGEYYDENFEDYPYDDTADGFEYIIGTSFLAPNCEDPDFSQSKLTRYCHDFLDVYWTSYLNGYDIFFDLIDGGFFGDCLASKTIFEFDAMDDTGIYMNGEGTIPDPDPEYYPPTAEANGDYSGTSCDATITFTCIGSVDNDESGSSIVEYRWDFNNDGTWDTGWLSFTDPTYDYTYPGEYNGLAVLEVKDNEDQTDTDTANVEITADCYDTTIKMENVYLQDEGTDYGRLRIIDADNVGSCTITLQWDPTKVNLTNVIQEDLSLTTYIDYDNGFLSLLGTAVSVNDPIIATLWFEALVPGPDQCDLLITTSSILDTSNQEISHGIHNGVAYIGEVPDPDPYPYIGDMNGDDLVNSGDVRHLAQYILNNPDPEFQELFDDGDVNSDTNINSGDVRHLAMYILGVGGPEYQVLYP